jgi:hypothetical protein
MRGPARPYEHVSDEPEVVAQVKSGGGGVEDYGRHAN